MAIAWFICRHKKGGVFAGKPIRRPVMNDFFLQIQSDGGKWDGTEVLGDRIITKVRVNLTTLTTIAGTTGFKRLPKNRLDDSLNTLTTAQKDALKTELLDMGYNSAELKARFGDPVDLGNYTLGDVLRFMATRRRDWRYDSGTDTFIFDGVVRGCKPISDVDKAVT